MVCLFPNILRIFSVLLCFFEPPDQRWQHMTVIRVVVVAWSIKIGWHQADRIKAMLNFSASQSLILRFLQWHTIH